MSLLAVYDGATLPSILQPVHPSWLSWSLSISDIFMLIATFCVAFEYKVLPINFWKFILVSYIFNALLAMYYEYNAGGYSQYEIIGHGATSLFILGIICLPIIYYFDDLKSEHDHSVMVR
ncbi:hypothetical protein GCM10009111_06530 [Colwellia asteriadis]|uniref:Uncharacterized protein n=2 Tax=Colwellia asteriadis TaxID=517723 RepID=A0ABP3WCV4_9GAMM